VVFLHKFPAHSTGFVNYKNSGVGQIFRLWIAQSVSVYDLVVRIGQQGKGGHLLRLLLNDVQHLYGVGSRVGADSQDLDRGLPFLLQ